MPYQLFEDAFGDPRNAAALAAASQYAYFPAEQGAEAFKNDFGMTGRLFTADNTQAYLAANDDHVVVVFREPGADEPDGLKDWFMTNAVNLLIQPVGDLSTEFAAAGVGAEVPPGARQRDH